MSKVKSCGNRSTEAAVEEVLVRQKIRGWVKHPGDVVGKPDFFFQQYRLAVFVDGCFWHSCPTCARNTPRSRPSFWAHKIEENRRRDNRVRTALRRRGYSVMRIWEHSVASQQGWLARLVRILDRNERWNYYSSSNRLSSKIASSKLRLAKLMRRTAGRNVSSETAVKSPGECG